MRAPECIGKLILEKQLKVIAEIGIYICSMSDQVRNYVNKKYYGQYALTQKGDPIEEYWMVDPYPYNYKCGSLGGDKITNDKWDEWYYSACKRMIADKTVRLLRLTSVKAAKLFPDDYFDLVYIDADHTKESVKEDCATWLPKVREGGILCGHDYGGGWQSVVNGVDEFFIERSGKKDITHFYEIDGGEKYYRMDSGVWVVEL